MQRVKGIELDLIHPMSNQPSNLISTLTRDSICILPVLRMHAFLCWQMLFYYGQNIQIVSKNYHSMARLNLDKSEELVTSTTTA